MKTVIPTFNKYFIVTESNDLYSVPSSFTNDTVPEFIVMSPIEIENAPALRKNDTNLTEAYILDESGEVQSVISGGKFVKIQPDNEYVMSGNKISVKNCI